jgi:hypothetical protein
VTVLSPALARLLAGPRPGASSAGWRALVAAIDEVPPSALVDVVTAVDEQLARQYGTGSLWFEDDERVTPVHWVHPQPSPKLLLARDLAVQDARALGAPGHAIGLEALAVAVADEAAWVRDLARSQWTHAIWHLRIADVLLKRDGLAALLAGPLCRSVVWLELPGCNIDGADGARVIARWGGACRLEILNLSFCYIQAEGLAALLDADMPALCQLKLSTNCLYHDEDPPEGYWSDLGARCEDRGLELVFV